MENQPTQSSKQPSHLPLAIISVILSGLIFGLLGYWFGADVNSTTASTTSPTASPTVTASSSPVAVASPTPPLTPTQLENTTYSTYALVTSEGRTTVKLTNGQFALSPDTIITLDTGHIGIGDINGDGASDAVVAINNSGGGTGGNTDIEAVLNNNGQPSYVAYAQLAVERPTINSISVNNGTITVTYTNTPPALSGPATQSSVSYKLINNQLVKQ